MKRKIYFIRHSQASFGQMQYDQLSELGKKQALLLKDQPELRDAGQIVTGTLKRQIQTAELVFPHKEFESITDWNELDYKDIIANFDKDFENFDKAVEKLKQKKNAMSIFNEIYISSLQKWMKYEDNNSYKENYSSFHHRVKTALDHVLSLPHDQNIVVTSGGIIAEILKIILGTDALKSIDLMVTIKNASITSLNYMNGSFRLNYFNYYHYLPKELQSLR